MISPILFKLIYANRDKDCYTHSKRGNRNSLCKIIFTWLQLSGYNYFTFIITLKSLHLSPKCSGMEELTGSKFCN